MYILSDILVIALLIKFLWDNVSAGLLPWPIFVVAFVGLPFLMGVGGRTGNRVVRAGVSLAGLAIFFLVHTIHNLHILYIIILVIGFGIYVVGSMARRMFSSLVIAIVLVATIIYFMVSSHQIPSF